MLCQPTYKLTADDDLLRLLERANRWDSMASPLLEPEEFLRLIRGWHHIQTEWFTVEELANAEKLLATMKLAIRNSRDEVYHKRLTLTGTPRVRQEMRDQLRVLEERNREASVELNAVASALYRLRMRLGYVGLHPEKAVREIDINERERVPS